MSVELLRALASAPWTVETVCCARRACCCAVAERLWRVRDEEGELVGILDAELTASLMQFFGVPRAAREVR